MEAFLATLWSWWLALWPHILAAAVLAITVGATCHAILTKRDTRSTIGWVGLIWLSPVFGAVAYAILGVNRIRSRASQLRAGQLRVNRALTPASPQRLHAAVGQECSPLVSLAQLVEQVTQRPLVDGNSIEPLAGGDEAYPRMLAAIDGATRSIGMASCIFDNDPTGKIFAAALGRAVQRGVAVRVLIDGIGSSYSRPSIVGL
ncbi:MAG: PLDc N-terminal domain-containing protein, partial [Planctomycetota bacterium]